MLFPGSFISLHFTYRAAVFEEKEQRDLRYYIVQREKIRWEIKRTRESERIRKNKSIRTYLCICKNCLKINALSG